MKQKKIRTRRKAKAEKEKQKIKEKNLKEREERTPEYRNKKLEDQSNSYPRKAARSVNLERLH